MPAAKLLLGMARGQCESPDGAQALSGEALAGVGWSCANSLQYGQVYTSAQAYALSLFNPLG